MEIALSKHEAEIARNGLSKAIYCKLFDWLVCRINTATSFLTGQDTKNLMDKSRFIGLLDIFGFEILERNSFEQLCINFANEMMQQQFSHRVFVYEQKLYVEEGIDWSTLVFSDNAPCLALITGSMGILPLLDEQSIIATRGSKASDEKFIQKLHQTHMGKHPNYSKPRFGQHEFIVLHYAGPVTYDVNGFLFKNSNSFAKELDELLENSQMELLKEMFNDELENEDMLSTRSKSSTELSARKGTSSKMSGAATVAKTFRSQMANLMEELNATTPSFVRCVKPNQNRAAQEWDAKLILDQLVYLGVMETVRIRRSGYPVRRTFGNLVEEYSVLKTSLEKNASVTNRQVCSNMLSQYLQKDMWQMGHRKVFLRDGQVRFLQAAVRAVKNVKATLLQAQYKRYRMQRWYTIW